MKSFREEPRAQIQPLCKAQLTYRYESLGIEAGKPIYERISNLNATSVVSFLEFQSLSKSSGSATMRPLESVASLSNRSTLNFHQTDHSDQAETTVQKGFNSDVVFKGMNFHIQSEDWGLENPFIVSRVYQNGAVIKSIKTSYAEVLRPFAGMYGSRVSHQRQVDPQVIRDALRGQHQKILDQLLSGQLF